MYFAHRYVLGTNFDDVDFAFRYFEINELGTSEKLVLMKTTTSLP